MQLKDFIDFNKLQKLQDNFSDATGLAAIAVDAEGNYITKGSHFTDFCMKYTRGSQEGLRRCVKCGMECTGTYFCHAGLMDFASDIIIDGEKVGAIIGGQVLPNPPDIEKFEKIAKELGIPEHEYIEALKKVPIRSEKMIRASAALLGDVVNQVVNLEYFKAVNKKKFETFDAQIKVSIEATRHVKTNTKNLQEIASMENIMSLNASIEAARAGRAGVGFAVVAREMGELSRNARSIYAEIQEDVQKIEKSIASISRTHL